MSSEAIEELKLDVKAFKKAENWIRCIELCREALVIAKPSDFSDWYWFKINLAQALTRIESTQRGRNIEEALSIYHEILKEVDVKEQPFRWAHTHRCLGFAYDLRSSGNKVENLDKMIDHLTQAISVFTKENYPEDWAITKAALAVAFSAKKTGDMKENLKQAIQCLEDSRIVLTYDRYPDDWQESEEELKLLKERLAALKK